MKLMMPPRPMSRLYFLDLSSQKLYKAPIMSKSPPGAFSKIDTVLAVLGMALLPISEGEYVPVGEYDANCVVSTDAVKIKARNRTDMIIV